MNWRHKFYNRSQSNSQNKSGGWGVEEGGQFENRGNKEGTQCLRENSREIRGKKHLLLRLVKNNTREKQPPHLYLCFKLHRSCCMVFAQCLCWADDILRDQERSLWSDTRSLFRGGSLRYSSRFASLKAAF